MHPLSSLVMTLLSSSILIGASGMCSSSTFQGVLNAEACIDAGCYYDAFKASEGAGTTCVYEIPSCFDQVDPKDDPYLKGTTWGIQAGVWWGKGTNASYDYCKGDMLYQVKCGAGNSIVTTTFSCPLGCMDGVCLADEDEIICTETDGGQDYLTQGTMTHSVSLQNEEDVISREDYCMEDGKTLHEFFCSSHGTPDGIDFVCPEGCRDGRCLGEERCTEDSNGKNYFSNDTIEFTVLGVPRTGGDTCANGKTLVEAYCDKGERKTILYTCPTSCVAGACTGGSSSKISSTSFASSSLVSSSPHRSVKSLPTASFDDPVIEDFSSYANPFPDTYMNSVWGKAAAELYRRSVIRGFPDGEFKGGQSVNRAEAAKFLLLARYETVPSTSDQNRFHDVPNDQWFANFVHYAAEKGIIAGYPDGLFRPANTVNTAEFLKMLSLTFDIASSGEYPYTDVKSDDWFAPYAGVAKRYDLFPDRYQKLLPSRLLTRGDVALVIYQYLLNR
ncbi:MAG: S-layer homology domain-containing protein [Candidatus Peribacteraceae bacterium]|nr:S-layer homology domain-containing protein [Candidatus Peribacteraceae bacterium]